MSNAIIYRRFPWENSWDDITDKLSVSDFDIEEQVNGAGVATLSVGNARRWAERAIFPGMQMKIYIKSPDGGVFNRPDFEGYVPPDFQRSVIGIESGMEIPVVGYYDLWNRTFNQHKGLNGLNIVSAMSLLNKQVERQSGVPYMDFAGFYVSSGLAEVSSANDTCKSICIKMRKKMFDNLDPFNPRFFHLLTTPREGNYKPLMSLRREPKITDSPIYTIEGSQLLNIDSEKSNTMLTSVLIGDSDTWFRRVDNADYVHKHFRVMKNIQDGDGGGYKSSYEKSPELIRFANIGRSITVTLHGLHQIPLLSLIDFNSDEEELQGNSIVYGRRVNRSGSIRTELLLRNLPDVAL